MAASKEKDEKIASLEAALGADMQAAEKGVKAKNKPMVRPLDMLFCCSTQDLLPVLHVA